MIEKAPELLFGGGTGGGLTDQSSQSMSVTLTKVREGKDDSGVKLCKETDIYALGMVSIHDNHLRELLSTRLCRRCW